MTDLRAACIHGRYDQHMFSKDPPDIQGDWEMTEHCPGGREVTIEADIDAAGTLHIMFERPDGGGTEYGLTAGRYILAAIGDDNE